MKPLLCLVDSEGKIIKKFGEQVENLPDNLFALISSNERHFSDLWNRLKNEGYLFPVEVLIKDKEEPEFVLFSGLKVDDYLAIQIIPHSDLLYSTQISSFSSDEVNIIRKYSKELSKLRFIQNELIEKSAQLNNEIARLNRELTKKGKKFEHISYYDSLTGVFNRRYLDEFGFMDVKRAKRYKEELHLSYIDVNNFKQINDNYGHEEGDRVLKTLAENLKNSLRYGVDKIFRLGGDEFLLLLPNTDNIEAETLLNRIKTILENSNISISYGLANLQEHLDADLNELIKVAEKRMYEMKNRNK